jgi:hypothetical protein
MERYESYNSTDDLRAVSICHWLRQYARAKNRRENRMFPAHSTARREPVDKSPMISVPSDDLGASYR